MAIIEGVLQEEIERLEKKIFEYEKLLVSLPRGTIFIRKMGGSSFVYRKRKENKKVVSEYLGNINDYYVKKQIELSEEYKRIKNNLRIAKKELHKLKRARKAYD